MIIVTGGAGLIGSAIVNRLNQLGVEDIIIVDHLGESEKWRNLAPLKFSDYIEKDSFAEKIEKFGFNYFASDSGSIKALFHLGACSSTTERDATYLIRNNFEYTKLLAKASLASSARFIYASSAATFGDGVLGFLDDEAIIEKLRPLNMYGYSKHLFDLWAKNASILDHIVGIKYFNVYGPNENHKGDMRSLVQKAYHQINETGKLKLFKSYRSDYADGEQLRDFIYVKDAAKMTIHFLDKPNFNGLFNVGGGETVSWNRLAAAVFRAMNKPINIEYIDMPETIRDKYQYITCADITKIKKSGYSEPLLTVEDAVYDYIKNYLMPMKHLGDVG